jgi:sugar phosphate isomerase/epimerase
MKYALCNELFGSLPLDAAAEISKKAGYGGIEFAPYTVFGSFSPADVKAGIENIKNALSPNSLAFVGFHWLLVDSRPMSLVSPDRALRNTAVERLKLLLTAAGELGGGVLVLGSPRQRSSIPGQTTGEAAALLRDELCSLADYAVRCNSTLLVEALDHTQCDTINTLAEAQELIDAASSPGISGMFDFHNCGDEKESWDALIRNYSGMIKHVHINEQDGGPPGSGASDYAPAFGALREIAYNGWISMEIFTQPADVETAVKNAFTFISETEEKCGNFS